MGEATGARGGEGRRGEWRGGDGAGEGGDVGGRLFKGGEVVIASGVGGRGRWGRRSGTEAEANCHMKDNENANVCLGYRTT